MLTGIAGLVTSQATVWALRATNAPVVAVASAVRDLTPGPLAVRLVHLVGHLDKPLLVAGTLVVLALCALCRHRDCSRRRHPLLPDLVSSRSPSSALAVGGPARRTRSVASGLAVVVGHGHLDRHAALPHRAAAGRPTGSAPGRQPAAASAPRRPGAAFLLRAGGVAAVAALAGARGRFASRSRRRVEQARRLLRLPVTDGRRARGRRRACPASSPGGPPNDTFYLIHTALAAPSISPKDWRLRIHGMVDRELTLSYDDLVGRKLAEGWVTLCCVSNEVGGDLIGNAWWSGVPVRELLAEAGVHDGRRRGAADLRTTAGTAERRWRP